MPRCNDIDIEDESVANLAGYLRRGAFNSVDLVRCYVKRVDNINHRLRYFRRPCILWFWTNNIDKGL